MRDRGGGLRAARPGLHRAGAAREPRRARGRRRRRPAAAADRAERHARRPALPHDRLRRARTRSRRWRWRRATAGYEYLAITDHSASHGLRQRRLARALRAPDRAGARAATSAIEGIELLAGSEVNILPDGSLDYDDELLARLDWVIASACTRPSACGERRDDRARDHRAIEHPLGRRDRPPDRAQDRDARRPYAIDVERVIEAAARTGTMLEINSAPDRRDLDDVHARAAAQAGVADPHRLRRAPRANARECALGHRDRAARLAHAGRRGQHAAVGEFAPLRKRARSRSGQPAAGAGSSSSATVRSTAARRNGASAASARSA